MISKFSVKKPFTVLVAVILILVLGTVSVTRMTPDLLPEMSFPYIVLFTPYVGAVPEEVEQTVSKPLEQALASLDDLKEIASTSAENYSTVFLTFEDSVNPDRAMLDIQQVVTRLSGSWPETVGTPTVIELSTDLIPTVVAAVSYSDMEQIELSSFVNDTLSPALEGTNGVASVTATGLIIEQIEIELNTEKIDRLNEILYGSIDDAAQEAFEELDEAKQKITEGKEELENARAELEKGQDLLNIGKWEANHAFDEAETKLDETSQQLTEAIAMLTEQRDTLLQQAENAEATRVILRALQQSASLLERSKAVLEASIEEIQNDPSLSDEAREAALESPRQRLALVEQGLAEIDNRLAEYNLTRETLADAIEQLGQLDETIAYLDEKIQEAKSGLAQVESGYDTIDQQRNSANTQMWNAQTKINEGKEQLESGATELENGEKQLDEALPFIKEINGEQGIPITTGFSLGATHAAIVFLRRPDLFGGVLGCSGCYDAAYFWGNWLNGVLYDNSPVHFLANMPEDHPYVKLYNQRKIAICVGQGAWEDEGRRTAAILRDVFQKKGIHAWVDFWGYDVNHDWPWWRKQIRYFLPWLLGLQ